MAGMKNLAGLVRELEEQLVICTRCGMCQAVCPLFEQTRKEADVARGKLALLDGLMKNLFSHPNGVNERLNRCLLCGSCAANCPSGVNVMEIFIKARAILAQYSGLSPVKKVIFKKMLAHPETFDSITQWAGKFQGIFTKKDKNSQHTSSAGLLSPLIAGRHFLPLAKEPFRNCLGFSDSPGNSRDFNIASGRSGLKVAFFTGCLIDKIFPGIGHASLDVLKFHGVGVYIPQGQGCCGIPALASGDMATFDKLVEHHIRLFAQADFDYLVTACATCTSTIKKLWPAMYQGRGSGFKTFLNELSEKTVDINQFLVSNCGVGTEIDKVINSISDNNQKACKETVTYHDPCHLKKSLGVADEPRAVIKASGHGLREMKTPDRCCGMGGSFNLFHYDISSKIGDLKQREIADTNCSIVATGCPACMMQISDMLAKNSAKVSVKHPVELYAESIREI